MVYACSVIQATTTALANTSRPVSQKQVLATLVQFATIFTGILLAGKMPTAFCSKTIG